MSPYLGPPPTFLTANYTGVSWMFSFLIAGTFCKNFSFLALMVYEEEDFKGYGVRIVISQVARKC